MELMSPNAWAPRAPPVAVLAWLAPKLWPLKRSHRQTGVSLVRMGMSGPEQRTHKLVRHRGVVVAQPRVLKGAGHPHPPNAGEALTTALGDENDIQVEARSVEASAQRGCVRHHVQTERRCIISS
jgi:hypothetical protein